jgi:hypothetical protein
MFVLLIFVLNCINYVDRIAISVARPAIAQEFHLSAVQMG